MQYDYWSSPKGRISRGTYAKRMLILLGILMLLILPEVLFPYSNLVAFLVTVPVIYVWLLMCMQIIKRLHDLDASGWWCLPALIPYLGWIYVLFLAFKRGNPGPNRFGPPPAAGKTNPLLQAQVGSSLRSPKRRRRFRYRRTDDTGEFE
ncbi:MAG: DUF805 domain-containing protein [Chlorobi bacterium]|nr:DUF805 domain-containing protein [Chlorobiota bacterium]